MADEVLEVGVDVEALGFTAAELVLRQFFTTTEIRYVNGGNEADRSRRFLVIWTRKEAVVKAVGVGLPGLDIHQFSVVQPIVECFGRLWRVRSFGGCSWVGAIATAEGVSGSSINARVRCEVA